MKKYITSFIILLFAFSAVSQVVVDSPEYQQMKASGTLSGLTILPNPDMQNPVIAPVTPNLGLTKASSCDCYVEPDASYILALGPNDDGSSALIGIPFNFCLYGQTYNSIYINNNGNITFTGPMATFSASAFPSVGNAIVAPFWADVDTGSPGNVLGQVLYKITPTAVYINWVNVGYYNEQGDKRNTFQLTITDGSDPVIESGNVAFCYEDMQWTTGAASQGVNGFGGVPATAGANQGDGVSFFLISRFDHAGSDFDGALGNPDGISWLDYKSFAFDACNVGNIPPIPDGVSSCDTFKVCSVGDTADISINFLSPEGNQSTSITYNNGGLASLQQIANISGNTAQLVLRIIGDPADAGYYTIDVTATDDYMPIPGVTTLSFVIFIDTSGTSALNPILTPLVGCDSVTLSVLNGPYDTYLWDDLSNGQTDVVGNTQVYGVTVSLNGCYKRVEELITVLEPSNLDLQGSFTFCPPATGSLITIADSLNYGVINWGLGNPALDTMFSNYLLPGQYTVTLTDTLGICTFDTTFTIVTQPALVLQADDTICVNTYTFTQNTGGSGAGTWSYAPSAGIPTFASNTAINTTVTFPTTGTYHLVFTDDNCGVDDTVTIIYGAQPQFNFSEDFFICPGDLELLVVEDSANMSSISWGLPNPAQDSMYSNSLGIGTYTLDLVSEYGCLNDTTFTITTQAPVVIDQVPYICGDSVEFNINTGGPVGTWTYYGSAGDVTFRDVTDINTGLKVDTYGFYNLVFTEPVCNDSDTLSVEFIPYLWVGIDDSVFFCAGGSIDISGFVPPDLVPFVDSYLWNTGANTIQTTVASEGYYSIVVQNVCGFSIDSIFVEARVCDIDLPNVLTVNGDNLNDGWSLLNPADIFTEFECIIVNRWGNIIYEFKDQYDMWNGNDRNGNPVSAGVYFYNIKSTTLDGEELTKQGFIQLYR
jgi:gliding motility-associated-like protein